MSNISKNSENDPIPGINNPHIVHNTADNQATILSPHLAQVFQNLNVQPQIQQVASPFQPVPPTIQRTKSTETPDNLSSSVVSNEEEEEHMRTEFEDELNFLVEKSFHVKEQKELFMPYIY